MSDKNTTPDDNKPERIAKRIARSGVCSRRDAERMIAEGLVRLNGKKLDTPAVTVTDEDEIIVDGKPLPERKSRVFGACSKNAAWLPATATNRAAIRCLNICQAMCRA